MSGGLVGCASVYKNINAKTYDEPDLSIKDALSIHMDAFSTVNSNMISII